MKTINLLVAVILLSCTVFAQNRSIKFIEGSFSKTKAIAKKEKKPIFIDAYTSWCGPCKKMANVVFKNDTVADYFNKTFINTKFDMEKGEGITLAKKYDIKSYPTFLVVDADGNLIHKVIGYQEPKDFIKSISNAFNPLETLSGMEAEYKRGNRKSDFIAKYLKALRFEKRDSAIYSIASEFMKVAPDAEKFSEDGWYIVKFVANDVYAPNYRFLIENQDKYSKVIAPERIKIIIDDAVIGHACGITKNNSVDSIAPYRKQIELIKNANVDAANVFLNVTVPKASNDADGCVKILSEVWEKPFFNKTHRFIIISTINDLVVKHGSKESINKMISLINIYNQEVKSPHAKESINVWFIKPLQEALNK